jgi:preprotein translocase subunit SecE
VANVAKGIQKENRVVEYLRETRSELRKVVWPTREEATNLTMVVIAVMLVMSAAMGLVDYIFARLFELVIR